MQAESTQRKEGCFTIFRSKFNNNLRETEHHLNSLHSQYPLFDPDLCSLCKGYQYFNNDYEICPSCKGTGLAKNHLSATNKAKLKLKKFGRLFIPKSELKYNHGTASHSDLSYFQKLTPSRPRHSLDPGRASQWARNYNENEVTEKLARLKRQESRDLDLKNMQPGLVALYQDIHCNNSDFDFTDIAVKHGKDYSTYANDNYKRHF